MERQGIFLFLVDHVDRLLPVMGIVVYIHLLIFSFPKLRDKIVRDLPLPVPFADRIVVVDAVPVFVHEHGGELF